MTAPSPFLPLESANLNEGPHNTVDARTTEAFEQQRDRILHITNYLEALHARLLVSTNGRPSVATVRDDD